MTSPKRPARRLIRRVARAALWVLVALAAALWLGRIELLARAIATAPNHGKSAALLGEVAPEHWHRSERDVAMRISVGPPDALLSVLVFDPVHPEPRATILVLHGIRDQKLSMVNLGHGLADRGFRAVVVDLRGHGRSSGDWLSYGTFESLDLLQVLDALQSRGLLTKRVGIYGGSYGAAVAIATAARSERVGAVVAVACFSSLREVVPDYLTHLHLRFLFTANDVDRALDRAGELGQFNPKGCDPASASRRQAQVLLLHGANDTNIPPSHSRRILEKSNGNAELVILPDVDHVTIFNDASGELWRRTTEWFDRWFP